MGWGGGRQGIQASRQVNAVSVPPTKKYAGVSLKDWLHMGASHKGDGEGERTKGHQLSSLLFQKSVSVGCRTAK